MLKKEEKEEEEEKRIFRQTHHSYACTFLIHIICQSFQYVDVSFLDALALLGMFYMLFPSVFPAYKQIDGVLVPVKI
jgi:hypothetical protein